MNKTTTKRPTYTQKTQRQREWERETPSTYKTQKKNKNISINKTFFWFNFIQNRCTTLDRATLDIISALKQSKLRQNNNNNWINLRTNDTNVRKWIIALSWRISFPCFEIATICYCFKDKSRIWPIYMWLDLKSTLFLHHDATDLAKGMTLWLSVTCSKKGNWFDSLKRVYLMWLPYSNINFRKQSSDLQKIRYYVLRLYVGLYIHIQIR